MTREESIQVANEACTALALAGRWLDTSAVRRRTSATDKAAFLGVLKGLANAGVVARQPHGHWEILNPAWNREDPFAAVVLVAGQANAVPAPQQGGAACPDLSLLEAKVTGLDTLCEMQQEKIDALAQRLQQAESLASTSVKEIHIKVHGRPLVELQGRPHAKLERVLKLANATTSKGKRLNVLLIGPAGSGKTYLASQVAESLDLPFSFNSCSAGMSEGHLLGRLLPTGKGGQFEYAESEFVHAWENGGVHLIDEVDASDPNTLIILNTGLANGHIHLPNRIGNPVAKRHKDFVCIAAANTYGTGADRQYVGRNQLDEAFLDRFRIGQVVMEYDAALEAYLCPDEELRGRLQAYRANCTKRKVRRIISSRFLEEAYAAKVGGVSDGEIDEALFGGWSADEIAKAKEGVHKHQAAKEEEAQTPEEYKENAPPPPPPAGVQAPSCPRHPGTPMARMASGKGWRCGCFGNRYKDGRWTLCNHCVWDR